MASQYQPKHAYGPGKPKSPVSGAGPLVPVGKPAMMDAAAVAKSKKKLSSTPDFAEWSWKLANDSVDITYESTAKGLDAQILNQAYNSLYEKLYLSAFGPKGGYYSASPEYAQVAAAMGFTAKEVKHLVAANDAGLTFAQIADLIEQHPPIYGSAMTALRVSEEEAFCAMVASKTPKIKQAAASWQMPYKYYFNAPNLAWYTNDEIAEPSQHDDAIDAMNLALWAMKAQGPSSVVIPKPGDVAKACGLWTPPAKPESPTMAALTGDFVTFAKWAGLAH